MIIQTLIVAFLVSYIGSIPPGTINISVMQLSIQKKQRAAIFMAFASTTVEFVYAAITVQFHLLLTENETIGLYFRMITSLALVGLGLWNIYAKTSSSTVHVEDEVTGRHGFRKGILLGMLNPMTIPFWLAITSQLEGDGWVDISGLGFWAYLIGLSSGTFCLLLTIDALGKRFTKIADNPFLVHKIPGVLLLALGVYFMGKVLF